MNDFKQLGLKPFDIGFCILDLVDILKKYNVPQKTGIACIKFYAGESLD